MNRWVIFILLALTGLQMVEPAFAARRVVRRNGRNRTVVVVHKAWPLKRAPRVAVVRPARVVITVAPAVFLTPVAFTAVALRATPARDVLVWEDSEVLQPDEDWTEFTLKCDTRGRQLFLEISSGRIQFDWAEVVFENGDTQVVDFGEKTHVPGFYPLLDFKDGRKVDHVRMVARARGGEAKLILRMGR